MPKARPQQLQRLVVASPFDVHVAGALAKISASDATRRSYRNDFDLWSQFCAERGVKREAPIEDAAAAFVEWMKRGGPDRAPDASATRSRRMSSLSSLYRELRRRKAIACPNPFSVDDGPKREKVSVEEPTPIARPDVVRKVLSTCDQGTVLGVRDAAIIRVLWSTGMRRVSILSMTLERLAQDPLGYVANVVKKGGEMQRVLIKGRAKEAFDRWLTILRDSEFKTGKIWREENSKPLVEHRLNRTIEKRAKLVGEYLTPHMLRVAFLTYNPADIEAKQDAAGHADPTTTQGYDRNEWRGREAFIAMPEVEDL
jgi:integrase/recombinase XerD